jgi:hypothetical protein
MAQFVELDRIRTDGGTQPRAAIIEDVVQDYAEGYARGDALPPMVLFFDGENYWLADGFHRYTAARSRSMGGLNCDVRQGTQRDAILYSVGCNSDHGLRRTDDDKRRAVLRLLSDPEWAGWSDREISRACRVSPTLVGKLRPADTVHVDSVARTFTHPKTGAPSTMNTANIGRRPEPPRPAPLPPITQPEASPLRERAFAATRADMDQNGPIFDAIEAIKREFAALPSPEEAAQRFPRPLRHTFSPHQAQHLADWFSEFGKAWAIENGDTDVIAAE